MEKNKKNTYQAVILFLFLASNTNAQSWKPQHWDTSCWAAVTENVFYRTFVNADTTKNIKECNLVWYKNTICRCTLNSCPSARLAVEGRWEYMNIIKKYASFKYLKNGLCTLPWSVLNVLKKPIIFSVDNEAVNTNHFVNIYNTQNFGINSNWLYIFDPLPTGRGSMYLKNYATYKLPTRNPATDSLQTTYYDFGKSGIYTSISGNKLYSSLPQSGVCADTIGVFKKYNEIDISNQFSAILLVIKSISEAKRITGLNVFTRLALGFPAIPLTNFEKEYSTPPSLVISKSRTQIIPIFHLNASNRIDASLSMLVLLRKSSEDSDSNRVVIDMIQKLKLPAPVITKLNSVLNITIQGGISTIRIPRGTFDFIRTEDGQLFLRDIIEKKYFDLSQTQIVPFLKNDFYEQILRNEIMDFNIQPIDKQVFENNNLGNFLMNTAFSNINAPLLQQRIERLSNYQNVKQVILFEKKN